MPASDVKRRKDLEQENERLKRLLAEAHFDNAALKDLLAKKTSDVRGQAASRCALGVEPGGERTPSLVGLHRLVARYRPQTRDDAALRERMRELAGRHRRYGYLRLHVLLRDEELVINRKRTYRLYRDEGLSVRRRRRCRLPGRERVPLAPAMRRNQGWSMISSRTACGPVGGSGRCA